jgi:hypothetical protein
MYKNRIKKPVKNCFSQAPVAHTYNPTQEAEIKRITIRSQPRKIVCKSLSQKNSSQKNIYKWKCHKETPCAAILKKQAYHFFSYFFLIQNQRTGGQNKSCLGEEGWYLWEGGRGGEMVKGGEYGTNTVYTYM